MLQQMNFLDSLCGKTCLEPSAAMEEMTSGPCFSRSAKYAEGVCQFLDLRTGYGNLLGAYWETVGALPGVYMTLNFGEFPSDVRESTLSQILEANVPEKYYLSSRACRGILNRASGRGETVPEMLREALEEAIAFNA